MEIEKIVSTVQEKVGNTDFSVQTIRKACELFPVAEGQEPDDAYFAKVAGFITGMQGQYNHDFSVKFKEAKKNLLTEDTFKDMSEEQLTQLKTLIGGIRQTSEPTESDDYALLKQQYEDLKKRLDDNDTRRVKAEVLEQIRIAMRAQNATDDYVLEQTLRGADIDTEKTVDDLAKDFLAKYDAEYLKCRGHDAPPRVGNGNGGKTETWLDRRFKQKAAREGWADKA